MAVPKKKVGSRGKVRYTSYRKQEQVRLQNKTHIVVCPHCGESKLSHRVCKECGKYKGRQVLRKKEASELTRVQA
jgi:large subunit ribosomal protein L32